jgi:hypothetical protein
MTVSIPKLAAGDSARAVLTLHVTRRLILAPDNARELVVAEPPPSELRKFLLPSPYIESRHPQIESLARQVAADKELAWDRVAAMLDWIRSHLEYREDPQIRGTVEALEAGVGDCEELTSIFIALCRASNIPARAVWLPGHCYPEFYLEDRSGRGNWFPCQAKGTERELGGVTEDRPILQKGDSFRVPGQAQPIRYVQPMLTARDAAAPPRLEWVMERIDSGPSQKAE